MLNACLGCQSEYDHDNEFYRNGTCFRGNVHKLETPFLLCANDFLVVAIILRHIFIVEPRVNVRPEKNGQLLFIQKANRF